MYKIAAAALAATLFTAGAANAAEIFTVDFWGGSLGGPVSTSADAADVPSRLPDASFTFTGPIDWFVGGPQNTGPSGNLIGAFITPNGAIANYSGTGAYASQAAFLGASLSDSGDSYSAFFQITGQYVSATTVSGNADHDDGASVYDYKGDAVLSSPGETSEIPGGFTLPAGFHTFTVDYVEGNGAPSVLDITGVPGVPEPATWAVMLGGFGAIGASMRRTRRLKAAAATA